MEHICESPPYRLQRQDLGGEELTLAFSELFPNLQSKVGREIADKVSEVTNFGVFVRELLKTPGLIEISLQRLERSLQRVQLS